MRGVVIRLYQGSTPWLYLGTHNYFEHARVRLVASALVEDAQRARVATFSPGLFTDAEEQRCVLTDS